MSRYLSAAAIAAFDNEVKHQYQGSGKLRNTVTLRTGVVGSTYSFNRIGRGMANQKASQADITPMDITHAKQVATLQDWVAGDYTDIFDQAAVNYDEQQEFAMVIANALARREDQLIIDAITACSFAATNDGNPATARTVDVSASANITVEGLTQVAEHFNDIEMPNNDRHIALKANGLQNLLTDPKATSSDYAAIKALVNGEINTFMGFKFHVIGTRSEGGLPGVTGDEIAYAWHKHAIGLAIGIDRKTEINYIAQKTSWLANGLFKAGAVAREPQGIVKFIYDETA
jgi:hypothetical protein